MENQFTICPGCGAQITNSHKCEFCGMSFGNDEPDTDSHYSTPEPEEEVLEPVNPKVDAYLNSARQGKPKTGFILGLISLFTAWIPVFGLPLPIIGLVKSNSELKNGKNSSSSAGKIMSIIGIIIGIIMTIVMIVDIANDEKTAETDATAVEDVVTEAPAEEAETVAEEIEYTASSYFATTKAYFYNDVFEHSITKKYMVEGDIIQIQNTQNGFGYGIFTNEKGVKTNGWLKMSDLKSNTICGNWESEKEDDFGYHFPGLRLEKDGTATYQTSDDGVYCGTYDFNGNNVIFTGKFCGDNADGTEPSEKFTFNVRGNTLVDKYGNALIRESITTTE
ncbi:MAG: hypothetical protein LBL13_13265 [Bacteroidales bacterium]|jgi:hypothetical protein|nr:hypothetical protein [Bacteroidales bacterium]